MIRFYSIKKSDKKIESKIFKSIKKVIKKNNFILGNEVSNFENSFSKLCNSKYSIGCSNGTDAITIALLSLNLPKNSEVILPAMTYASTFYAVINAKLKPVLVDINDDDPLINLNQIERKINNNTKAIIPVHLYGSVVNLFKLNRILRKKKIYIIDDCSQAHGAMYDNGKRVGGHGISNISTFSLYPGKNLGAYGDAGIITTNNKKFYTQIKSIRNIGAIKKFDHKTIGFNNRMDTIQAAILSHKIKYLKENNSKRVLISKKYFSKIINKKIKFINYSKNSVFHQFIIRVKDRNKFLTFLKKNKIEYGLHYPHTINQMKFFKKKYGIKRYINSEKLAKECVSLPIDPMLTNKEVNQIINTINRY